MKLIQSHWETWGTHYLPTELGNLFHWAQWGTFNLLLVIFPLAMIYQIRKRRTEDDKLKKLMRGGHLGRSAN